MRSIGRNDNASHPLSARATPPLLALALSLLTAGCADLADTQTPHPFVGGSPQGQASLTVDASHIAPMYHELLTIDLPIVTQVAMASNLDIKEAQQHVQAMQGQYYSSIGAIFPVVSPNVEAQRIKGAVTQPNGALGVANFSNVIPALALQWIINPGAVVFDIIAAKRRLEATAQQAQASVQDTLRTAADQYYDLVLAQAQVSAAQQNADEATELLRLERLKLDAGTGLPADVLRAQAALASAQQDLLTALNSFYNASVSLTFTLHLDPTVMLVPKASNMKQLTLVKEDLAIDNLLLTAVNYRPDLKAVRDDLEATEAEKNATIFSGVGPGAQATGVIERSPPANTASDTMYRQQKYNVVAGFNFSASSFGDIKEAIANDKIAAIDLDRQLDKVKSDVVTAHQASIMAAKEVPIATQQVASAEEALRLTRENFKAGTALTVDVLQAEGAADQAHVRYATAIVRYNQSQVNLLATLGILDDQSIRGAQPAPPAK